MNWLGVLLCVSLMLNLAWLMSYILWRLKSTRKDLELLAEWERVDQGTREAWLHELHEVREAIDVIRARYKLD